jgi:hypothetical protein
LSRICLISDHFECQLAFGEAARLGDVAWFAPSSGPDFAFHLDDEAETIEREVIRRMGPEMDHEEIRMAVEDALEGRRPRW